MTLKIRIACFVLAVGTCALAGCGAYSEVNEIRPSFRPVPVGPGVLANAEAEITKGLQQDRSQPTGALDEYLALGTANICAPVNR